MGTKQRLEEYFTKVKNELVFATDQLRSHNREHEELEEAKRVIGQELASLVKQSESIEKIIRAKDLELQQQKSDLENAMMEAQTTQTDLQEQIEAETQVMEGLEEYLARTKTQLDELQGSRE